ncbi:MAG: hypothetical protein IJP31_05525 [Lachnospiraceae bacterium]|nr:hypothetical protein [Lachnospiraceae bacterium]
MSHNNSLRDEIRLQRQKMAGQPLKKKLEYYWSYYRTLVIILVLAACMLGSFLHSMLTRKETVLSVAYINAFPNIEDSHFMEGFDQYLKLNTKRQETCLDSSFYISETSDSPYTVSNRQRFIAMAAAHSFDVVVADEYYFTRYAKEGYFQDLRFLLSAEQLESLQDHLLYRDLPGDGTDSPVPVGINVSQACRIVETSSYPNTTAYYGIMADSEHTDNALSFLSYLNTSSTK